MSLSHRCQPETTVARTERVHRHRYGLLGKEGERVSYDCWTATRGAGRGEEPSPYGNVARELRSGLDSGLLCCREETDNRATKA